MNTAFNYIQPNLSSEGVGSPRDVLATRLPGCLQGLVTQLTGKPLPGQAIPRRSELGLVIQGFSLFAAGIGGGIAATSSGGLAWLALPLAWGFTLAGARDLQLNVMHQASHANVVSKSCSNIVGRAVSAILIETAFPEYVIKHRQHHKHAVTSTEADDTVVFLRDYLHIKPGLPVAENRKRFVKHLLSPSVWFKMLKNRLRSQLSGDWQTRSACLVYLGGMGLYTAATGQWLGVLLGWAVPLFVLYPIAKSARAIVEHRWPSAETAGCKRDAKDHAALSFAVRCAVLPPAVWTLASALRWGVAMVFNALIRVCVLPGESGPSHAWHHDQPKGDWANPIAAAAAWEAGRVAKGLPPVDDAWGYVAALDMALESFEKASPASLALLGGEKVQP